MVNKIIILVFIMFCSCKVNTNIHGMPRKEFKYKNFNISDEIYNQIDTMAVYKRIRYYFKNGKSYDEAGGYIRFYSKGKCSYFPNRPDSINRNYFDPSKGNMGRYYLKNKILYFELYLYGEGWGIITKEKIEFKGDTLLKKKHVTDVYVKQVNIPKEWLTNWKPDW